MRLAHVDELLQYERIKGDRDSRQCRTPQQIDSSLYGAVRLRYQQLLTASVTRGYEADDVKSGGRGGNFYSRVRSNNKEAEVTPNYKGVAQGMHRSRKLCL